MSFQLHEWDIHIVCFGTDGAGVTEVRHSRVRRVIGAGYSPVWSSTSASGAFFLTDSIPFSADALRS